jgi:hypothetical protein
VRCCMKSRNAVDGGVETRHVCRGTSVSRLLRLRRRLRRVVTAAICYRCGIRRWLGGGCRPKLTGWPPIESTYRHVVLVADGGVAFFDGALSE